MRIVEQVQESWRHTHEVALKASQICRAQVGGQRQSIGAKDAKEILAEVFGARPCEVEERMGGGRRFCLMLNP